MPTNELGQRLRPRRGQLGLEALELFSVGAFNPDELYHKVLADLGKRTEPELPSVISEMRAMAASSVLPGVMQIWEQQVAARYYERFIEAWKEEDLAGFAELVKGFAKGFAEARVPFHQLYDFFRFWDTCMLQFVVKVYRNTKRVRMLIEAWELVDQIYTVVSAQAYAEVYELTIAHLSEELHAHRDEASHQLWPASLKSFRNVGLEDLLPRLIARRMVEAPSYPPGEITQVEGCLVHTGPHLCGPDCLGDPNDCLTARLVEAKVEGLLGVGVAAKSIQLGTDNSCSVQLEHVFP